MGWLRDNWLDAVIFVLFALVVAGVVLFLTGVNPFARPPASSPAQSAPPQTAPPASPTPSEAPAAANPPVQVIPVLPKAPSETPPATPAPAPASPTQTSSPALASGGWRVAVGAFSDPSNATRLADTLRGQGYPVQLEPAGGATRVVLGPFPSEERARAVAQGLSQYETRVYRGATANPVQPWLYLQVGAFRSSASAETLVSQLKTAGYPVVLAHQGDLIRVRVGPVSEDRLEQTKSGLRGLGLSPLEVR